MTNESYQRLFRAIFSENLTALKNIANAIMQEERQRGHNTLADSLQKIAITEKPPHTLSSLPEDKRTNSPLVSYIPRKKLKHHMILPTQTEERLLSIEKEYTAKERLGKYNLEPKKKILFYGCSGCGKTLSAERLAWGLGLPLLKIRFDAVLSSFFGESASHLRKVFEYCRKESVILLLDEFDFIAKSRVGTSDVGEVPRIVNMLLTLLEGLVIATTNLKISLDEALFRRFDDIIEIPMPGQAERKRLLEMTVSAIPLAPEIDLEKIASDLKEYSPAHIVSVAQQAAKIGILAGCKEISREHFAKALAEEFPF